MRRLGLPAITLCIVGLWLLLPVIESGVPAQDAIPLLVAGDLVTTHPDDVYSGGARDLYDLNPRFRAATCEAYDDAEACAENGVAFISTPLALPVVALIAQLGVDVGVFVVRLLGAGCMAAGFVLVARRLGLGDAGLAPLTVGAGLLLLDVAGQVELGQTSPLLLLLASLSISRLRSPQAELVVALAVALAVAFKGFPLVLLVPMVVARRWRMAGLTLGSIAFLVVASLAVGAGGLWPDFLDLSRTVAEVSRDNPYNASAVGLGEAMGLPDGVAIVAGLALAVAFVVGVLARVQDDDLRWAAATPTALLVLPQVWNHYLVSAIPMVVVAASGRSAHPGRWLLAAIVALAPYAAVADRGAGWQAYGFLFVVGALGAVTWLVRERRAAPVNVT